MGVTAVTLFWITKNMIEDATNQPPIRKMRKWRFSPLSHMQNLDHRV